jgi:calcineurin-like phosphoesterase family protein
MACYRKGGCGPYEMYSCSTCPASKPEYALIYKQSKTTRKDTDNMSDIWFIADTHFYHNNIIDYCDRPFKNVEEMNNTIITNWNNVVKENDKVFLVGDFALSNKRNIIEIGKKLHGRKTLILGNHDRENNKTYYEAGFHYISKYPIIFQDFYIISHYPQFIQENGIYVNIFGHVHDNSMYKNVSKRSFCVSAERINYTPINFSSILNAIKKENKEKDD